MEVKKLGIGIILAIVFPMIFVLIELIFAYPVIFNSWLTTTGGLASLQFWAVFSFNVLINYVNVPLLGNTFAISILIWIISGFLVGIITREPRIAVISVLISILVHFGLFLTFNLLSGGVPVSLIDSSLVALVGTFSAITILNLFMYISLISLILPSGLFGGILGGVLHRRKMEI